MPTTSRLPSPKGGGDRGGGGAPKPCAPPGSSSGRGIRACSHVSGSAACTWASSGFPSGWATLCATDGRRASYPNPGPGVKATPCPSAPRIHLPPDRVTRRPARTIRGESAPPAPTEAPAGRRKRPLTPDPTLFGDTPGAPRPAPGHDPRWLRNSGPSGHGILRPAPEKTASPVLSPGIPVRVWHLDSNRELTISG